MLRVAAVSALLAVAAACIPFGDAFVLVTGRLVDEDGKPLDRCQIRLFRTGESGEEFAYTIPRDTEVSWVTGSEIRNSFLIDGGVHEYFVMIGCAEYSQAYKSGIFTASGFSEDINLGTVMMKR